MKKKRRRAWGSARTRSRQRPEAVAVPLEDLGTAERWRKVFGSATVDEAGQVRREVFRALEVEPRLVDHGGRSRQGTGTRNRAESPLDALYLRGVLGDLADEAGRARALRRLRAGQRLRSVHGRAGIAERTTVNLHSAGGGGGREGAERQSDEEAALEMVYHRMLGACGRSWQLVRDVCCDLVPPSENAVEVGRLVAGLDALAAHLRLRDDDDDGVPEPPAAGGRWR